MISRVPELPRFKVQYTIGNYRALCTGVAVKTSLRGPSFCDGSARAVLQYIDLGLACPFTQC